MLDTPAHYGHFIAGKWQPSRSGAEFETTSPATGRVLAQLAEGDRDDARDGIAAARAAFPSFAALTNWERAALCNRIADELTKCRDDLAKVLSEEQGKPLHAEAYGEVDTAAKGFREAAEMVKYLEGEVIPAETPGKRVISFRQPRGVYAVITPWNFPINIPVEYLAAAIATGNTVVWVPAPTTSLCAVKLVECLANAGLPEGVVNLITGPGPVVGDEISGHPDVNGIGFTGSPVTGQKIATRGAGKPMLLELGGNGPVIVLDDADLSRAAQAAAFGCFRNAGQVCAATGRILVTRKNHDALAEKLVAAAQAVVLGDPSDKNTTMGPLNNPGVIAKVQSHVADGKDKGADIVCGGQVRADLGSDLFFEPTVMANVPLDSLLNQEETFGPVAPLVICDDEDHMLAVANAASHGLSAAVFTRDLVKAHRFGEGLRTGIVNINGPSSFWELHIPFGGASGKSSGLGRLGGKNTLREMMDVKTVIFDIN